MLTNYGYLRVQQFDLSSLTFPFFLMPGTSALSSLHLMLPNTSQSLDNRPPAHLMEVELRAGL